MERKRTAWKFDCVRCSLCGHKQIRRTNFCPNCGAQTTYTEVLAPVAPITWLVVDDEAPEAYDCSGCGAMVTKKYKYCPRCGGAYLKI